MNPFPISLRETHSMRLEMEIGPSFGQANFRCSAKGAKAGNMERLDFQGDFAFMKLESFWKALRLSRSSMCS